MTVIKVLYFIPNSRKSNSNRDRNFRCTISLYCERNYLLFSTFLMHSRPVWWNGSHILQRLVSISSNFLFYLLFYHATREIEYTGWSKKQHKVYGTIILQPYITESCGFQQNVSKKNSLHDLSQFLNKAVKYSLFLPLASELLKNSITFNVSWSTKNATIIFSIAPWNIS